MTFGRSLLALLAALTFASPAAAAKTAKLTLPTKDLGYVLSIAAKTAPGGKKNPAVASLISALNKNRTRAAPKYDRALEDHWWAGGVELAGKVLGLDVVEGKSKLPLADVGPLKRRPGEKSVVEGTWTVGQSNGSTLRGLIRWMSDQNIVLTRGTKVGLRASYVRDPKQPWEHGIYVSVVRDLKHPKAIDHFFIGDDEGAYVRRRNEASMPKVHLKPIK